MPCRITKTRINTDKITIKGFLEISFIDWDGRIAAVIFLPECNFRCRFCHAVDLVLHPQSLPKIAWGEIESYLQNYKDWIDGVVISGGEPTLYPALEDLILSIKNMGIPVKLDTNGTNPSRLRDLLAKNLLDYAAMDLKGPAVKYPFIVSRNIDFSLIKESLDLLRNSSLDYEIRTTVVPNLLDTADFISMLPLLRGVKKYVLQQFRPGITIDSSLQEIPSYPLEKLEEFRELLIYHSIPTIIRGINSSIPSLVVK